MNDQPLPLPLAETSREPGHETAIAPGPPPDQPARDRVATDLRSTLFVEAGAGSGKTSALVTRILALVAEGIPIENIAAITFTEKAATELRQRVRDALVEATRSQREPDSASARAMRADSGSDRDRTAEAAGLRNGAPDARLDRYGTALDQLDGAAISTLHSFAQRLLFEYPIEAGLPPGVEVLDEIESQIDFDQRWDGFVVELLDDERLTAALLAADVLGVDLSRLRRLALQLEQNWDLVLERPPVGGPLGDIDATPFDEAVADLQNHLDHCLDHDDKLAQRIIAISAYAIQLRSAAQRDDGDPDDRFADTVELLSRKDPAFSTASGEPYTRLGAKRNWIDSDTHEAAKLALHHTGAARDAILFSATGAVVNSLAAALAGFVGRSVEQRRRQGRLRFHDLLVMAREMLRSPSHGPSVRASLRERYQRLLIDEFQDTDPIQVELAALIAAEPGSDTARVWSAVPTTPGRLFFVGDPKQSIYRFRRADIGVYLQAQQEFGGDDGLVHLHANFRSGEPVIHWVNRVFERLIRPEAGSQPEYVPLVATRSGVAVGPGVAILGADEHGDHERADDMRRSEAAEVAVAITTAIAEGWEVSVRDGAELTSRPARFADMAVLVPSRTSLPALEQALDEAGVPYRAEAASLVYSSPEVRNLLLVARAVDDPSDELTVVAALRSSAFGCGDDDLLRYRRSMGGSWNHQALAEDLPDNDPVVRGLRWMARWHETRSWSSPSQILDTIVRDRRLLELGVVGGRHREVWKRIRFVLDQARAWSDSRGGTLREYLSWVAMQASDSARVAEAILPETDTDAVRIMTIHAAKGLEFPLVIVSGLTARATPPRAGVGVLWPPTGPPGISLGSNRSTPEYETFQPIDEQLDHHERLRLLYVACTRARDHLVVSLHRKASEPSTLASALAAAGAAEGVAVLDTRAPSTPPVVESSPPTATLSAADWARARAEALNLGARSTAVSATALARVSHEHSGDPGLAKEGRNLDLPPWQKGRYGTAIGRAVHAVLQSVDLGDGSGLEQAVAAQAAAEGILGRELVVAALARAALESDTVRTAARVRHWRELFVAAPVGDRVVEGYVDLAYREGGSLVIVDYKTDAWAAEGDLEEKVARYRVQTATYARALETATGIPVHKAVLLFLAEEGAVAREVPALREAIGQLDRLVELVRAGGEAVVED